MQTEIHQLNAQIDAYLLKPSIEGHKIDKDRLDQLESTISQLNSHAMEMADKVELKKMQLRLQSYKRNQNVMAISMESEQIGTDALQQLRVQRDQLHRIDSAADTVNAHVDKSHQVIVEMRKRKRRMKLVYASLIAAAVFIIVGVVVVAVVA